VRSTRLLSRLLCLLALAALVVARPAQAEEVNKRFRLSVGLGFLNNQGKAESDSANTLFLTDNTASVVDTYTDPRNDSAVFGSLEFQPGPLASISGQYAFTPTLLVELSAGYQKTKLGDIEVQGQFDGVEIPDIERFDFRFYQIEAGDVERVPLELSLLARFRPRARLNPYLGGGVGYTFVGFEPSDELNQLSVNMDGSQGRQFFVTSSYFGTEQLSATTDALHDLDGAHVDIGGTWTWHGMGGLELSFKRKWVAYLDLRYAFSERTAEVSFDGTGDFGTAVPTLTDYCANPPGNVPPGGTRETICPGSQAGAAAFNGEYGPIKVELGGLLDVGRLAPRAGVPGNTDCTNPFNIGLCEFVFEPDGRLDTGYYYAQGGTFSYDAFTMTLGVRYTF
jgi:hypothetical protein